MKVSITKGKLYQILFTICVAVPYLNNYELTFLIWFFSAFLTLRKSYSKAITYQVACFVLIMVIAFSASFFNDFKAYDLIRDITYLVKPVLGLLIGYQICKNYLTNPLKTIVYTGVLISIIHLLIVFYSFAFLHVRDVNGLRYYAGYFSDFEVYVLIILIFNKQLNLDISLKNKRIFLIIIALSSLFYLSRTNFIQFVILFMALKGYFVITKRSLIIVASILVSSLLFYSAILYINPKRNGSGIEAFLYKVKIAPTEPFKTKVNKADYKDFNDNYRSVENILTVAQMSNEEPYKLIIGKGLGSTVDLNTEVWLDETKLRYISILHNGFMTVFLKSGLLGVLLLTISIVLLLKKYRGYNGQFRHLNYLLVGTTIFLFFSYWVFMGYYFKADTKAILIGLIIALIEKRKQQINSPDLTISG